MLFEHYHSQDLLTSTINDGGVNKLNSSLTTLDFYLLDDISAYLSPISSKKYKNDINNDSIDNNQYEELFTDFDLPDFEGKLDAISDLTSDEELNIEQWISESAFPSPPTDSSDSPYSNSEDMSPTCSWIGDDFAINTDMIVPPSPPLSSTSSSSPVPSSKRTKLSTVERRMRKKTQNKTAAEKYRIKKKSERHQLLDRHSKLQTINKELKSELENLSDRVQKIKQLFTDILHNTLPVSN